MQIKLFEIFSSTVDALPPKAVLATIRLERQMIEEDLSQKRATPLEDANSILSFCRFLENSGQNISPRAVPERHFAFYATVVNRLVEAGELPADAIEKFNFSFSPSL